MRELEAAALELGMYVLVEVPNPAEMEEALQLKSSLLGINNRNLKTLEVDLSVARDYAAMVPDTHRLVGESGLRTKADLDALAEVGVTRFLVGESLMREAAEIGRASCRERVCQYVWSSVVAVSLKHKNNKEPKKKHH